MALDETQLALLKDRTALPEERLRALLALMQTPTTEAQRLEADLVALFTAPDEELQLSGALALCLGQVGSPACVAALVDRFEHSDNDPSLRLYCVQGLAASAHPTALPCLVAALHDSNNEVFSSAAQGLAQFGRQVVAPLRTLLTTGPDDARCVAAWQLGEQADTAALPELLQVARHDTNPDVQALALWALGELALHRPDVLDVLNWAKQQANPELRLRAETALTKVVRLAN